MGRIYTRSGDKGTTAIHGGIRLPKTDIRIETNGTLDELNVAVGKIRTQLSPDHEWQPFLKNLQINLMTAMSLIATRSDMISSNPNNFPQELVKEIEQTIDRFNLLCASFPSGFILPGGTSLAVALHEARVICRRGERKLWLLNEFDPVPQEILQFFNRLSDLFFVMARYDIISSDNEEEIWKNFGYKTSSNKKDLK